MIINKGHYYLPVLLIVILAFSTAGCGKKSPEPEASASSAASSLSAVSADSAEVITDDAASSGFAFSDTADSDEAFEPGTISGSLYRNPFFDLKYSLPDDWVWADEEQLQAMNSAVTDAAGAAEETGSGSAAASPADAGSIRNALENGQAWFDMYAARNDGYQNINVTVQNIRAVYGALTGVDTLIDTSLENLQTALEGQGAVDVVVEKGTASFLGESSLCTKASGAIRGVKFYETQVYMKKGSYILCATAVSYSDDQTAELIGSFTRL